MGSLENILTSDSKIDRRTFLKTAGLLGVGFATGCQILGGWDPNTSPPEDFSIEGFTRWFKNNRLYKGVNPNLKRPHRHYRIGNSNFKKAVYSGRITPGVDYQVPSGEVMVASAPGAVKEIKALHTGRAGGMMVTIGHPHDGKGMTAPPFETLYAHLSAIYVKEREEIERGQPIGNVTFHNECAKLLVRVQGNLVDPDKYGLNYSFMDYLSNHKKGEIEEVVDGSEMDIRSTNRYNILWELNYHAGKYKIGDRIHVKRHKYTCRWSDFEKFQYLEELYKAKPDLFPNLSQGKFQNLKKDFYDNQPVVLTLPFVEGGMRR